MKNVCEMMFVSNAGIVLETEGSGVGIDCFCRDESGLYANPPESVRECLFGKIREGKIGTLIFTHGHPDHFCADDVEEALSINERTVVCAGEDVTGILRERGIPPENLVNAGDLSRVSFGPFEVTFVKSAHAGKEYAGVPHMSLFIRTEEVSFAVAGDALPSAEFFGDMAAVSKKADWFAVPFPYVGLVSNRGLMKRYLDVSGIFALHFPRREADGQRWRERTREVCDKARDGLPYPVFLERAGECHKL